MPATTKYIWDENNLLAEADGTDTIQTVYTNEPEQYGNLVSSRLAVGGTPATAYHHFDAIGSTRQLTNAASGVTNTATYDAWGNVVSRTGVTNVAFLWIGELEYYSDSDTGIFSVRRRPYSTLTARWTTVDPLDVFDGLPRYLYGENSPPLKVDPSGLATWTCECVCTTPGNGAGPPTPHSHRKDISAASTGAFQTACTAWCASLTTPFEPCVKSRTSVLWPVPGTLVEWVPLGNVQCSPPIPQPAGTSICCWPTPRNVQVQGKLLTTTAQPLSPQVSGGNHRICAGLPPATLVYGGGGVTSSISLVIHCPGMGVVIYHFGTTNSDVDASLRMYIWPTDCHAAIAGGNSDWASRCLMKDTVAAVKAQGITLDGFSQWDGIYIGSDGKWYHHTGAHFCPPAAGCP